ncbi:MAG: carboxylating nicotinate-nucleotide diphosphorylase [Oscillospiraceae bacterium]|jgi:nicotinate-nucleotide pyrophosphorylase (carboxylating)|nr:carboxylating nicotinate-nucleotide diphosphorylase [Oscillospiraceae bacterium]
MNYLGLDELLLSSLREDLGGGDITTECCVAEDAVSGGRFVAKADGVICGLAVAARVFALLDRKIVFTPRTLDGERVSTGEVIAEIEGPSRGILTGERLALNLLQHLSGVATMTAQAASQISGTGAKIVDTRKCTPGLRVLEKYAVRVGGGSNHRFNLSDGVLIKDNHIAAAGSISSAVSAAKATVPHTMKIEVEVSSLEGVREALDAGADIIMLDNMDCAAMSEAVSLIDSRALTEASGNMGERDLREVAETGVDFISIGALTHSVKALDISLQITDKR